MGAVRDRVREEGSRGERSEGEGVGSRGKKREGLRGKRGLGHQLSLRGGRARVMFSDARRVSCRTHHPALVCRAAPCRRGVHSSRASCGAPQT